MVFECVKISTSIMPLNEKWREFLSPSKDIFPSSSPKWYQFAVFIAAAAIIMINDCDDNYDKDSDGDNDNDKDQGDSDDDDGNNHVKKEQK